MSWLEAKDQITQRLSVSQAEHKPVFGILGPHGSGKTAALLAAIHEAKQSQLPAFYLDLHRCPEGDPEAFFAWLLDELSEKGWNLSKAPVSARLDFVSTLLDGARTFSSRAIVALDHVETISDENAKELISKLREYQERVDRRLRDRVTCIVAGCVSLEDLRRRANSPNLQFDFCTIPLWEPAGSNERAVEYHFAERGMKIDHKVLAALADYTGGEPAFLKLLDIQPRNGAVKMRDIDRAVNALLSRAADCPYLSHIARQYWIDDELRRYVDILIANRDAHAKGGALAADIDPFQMLGVFVAEPVSPYRYAFRNELVRHLFERLHDAYKSVRTENVLDLRLQTFGDRVIKADSIRSLSDWDGLIRLCWEELQLGTIDELATKFIRGPEGPFAMECWATVNPLAFCERKAVNGRTVFTASVRARDPWRIELEVISNAALDSSVRTRHIVQRWLKFLAATANRAITLHLAGLGLERLNQDYGDPSGTRRNHVFVVYGRNTRARDAFYDFLRSLKLEPIDWLSAKKLTGKAMPSVFEVVDAGMSHAQACVVLLTGDDEARLRAPYLDSNDKAEETELYPQPRANVIFEAGMALGRYQNRTTLVEFDRIRPFSDVEGFARIRYKSDAQFREEVIQALETAHCPADRTGDAWRSAGRFPVSGQKPQRRAAAQ